MHGEDSGDYDLEAFIYAKKILLQFKSNSINFDNASIRDLIWIEAVFILNGKADKEIDQWKIDAINDMRALLKDLDDVQRMSLTGKKSSILKWTDLPSQTSKKKPEMNDEVRIAFLKNVSKRFEKK